MYYKHKKRWNALALMGMDGIHCVLSFYLAGLIRFGSIDRFSRATDAGSWIILVLLCSFGAFVLSRMHSRFMSRRYFGELKYVGYFHFWFVFLLLIILFATRNQPEISRLTLFYFLPINVAHLFIAHCLWKKRAHSYARGKKGRKTLIISDAEHIMTTFEEIQLSSEWKDSALGSFILDAESMDPAVLREVQAVDAADCIEYLRQNPVDEILLSFAQEKEETEEVRKITGEAEKTGAVLSKGFWLPQFCGTHATHIINLQSFCVANFTTREFDYLHIVLKRCMDIAGGLIGSLLTVVIGLLLAPFLLLESPGPLLFRQKRVGLNGRIFTIYKFRSMFSDAEKKKAELVKQNKMKGLLFKIDKDPRITRVGRFLRKTSIDEFPQFFNVLLGDMSLVGTRPPTLDEYRYYSCAYKKRLSFRPGITGIWQTSGRNDITDFASVLQMDLDYIQKWSLLLDIKLIIKTVWVVLFGKGAV